MTPWVPSALMNHLWQSTLFVIVVWLATLALRKNAARVRCWLWTAASVKFLVPLSMLVSLGERFQWRAAPAAVQPAVSFVMQDVLAPAAVVVAAPASIPQSAPGVAVAAAGRLGCGSGRRARLLVAAVAADPEPRCAARRRCGSTRSTARPIWRSCPPRRCRNRASSASVARGCCFPRASSSA